MDRLKEIYDPSIQRQHFDDAVERDQTTGLERRVNTFTPLLVRLSDAETLSWRKLFLDAVSDPLPPEARMQKYLTLLEAKAE